MKQIYNPLTGNYLVEDENGSVYISPNKVKGIKLVRQKVKANPEVTKDIAFCLKAEKSVVFVMNRIRKKLLI